MDIYPKKPGPAIKLTQEVNEQLSSRGITMLDEYTGALKMNIFQCNNGHKWVTSPNSVLGGTGCMACHRQSRKLTTDDFRKWLLDNNRDIFIVSEYVAARTKAQFECKCGHKWESTPNNIKKGQGCPKCAKSGFRKDIPAWTYIIKYNDFIKYGITNDLERRLGAHRKNGQYEVVFSQYHNDGNDAVLWESAVKKSHGGKFVSKEKCPDGYTETLPLEKLNELLSNHTLPG